jgi:hypothetical protein
MADSEAHPIVNIKNEQTQLKTITDSLVADTLPKNLINLGGHNTNTDKIFFMNSLDVIKYHTTLPEGPRSCLRSELLLIIIPTTAIPEDTFHTIYTDSKSLVAPYKK